MALEEYIRQVKETWTTYHLELVNYQNKIRLIRCVVHKASRVTFANILMLEGGMTCSTSAARI